MIDILALDAHEIVPGLWQGSMPASGSRVADAGFDVLVFCAEEYQPPSADFPGVEVIHAPNDDDPLFPMRREDLQTAVFTATVLQGRLSKGNKILVTCMAGINRSGLLIALTLHKVFGYSGQSCIRIVRARRKFHNDYALRNPYFVEALLNLPGEDLLVLPGSPLTVL